MIGTAAAVILAAAPALLPTPRLQLSDWADRHYYLSAESSADPGPWHTLPYQREWMDSITDPRVAQIAVIKSSRVGATKVLNAAIGYYVVHKPSALFVIQPTEDDAKGYAKEEVDPMIRDCPTVGERFAKTSKRAESMLHRRFRGGLLQIVGAMSPANFRRVSRGVILGDEVDGYPISAGKEGDPVSLATRRADYFGKRKRKLGWFSTPTIAGASRIERLFLEGDQRRYYVPCPHCQEKQVLQFKHLKWPPGQPELAVFTCIHCGCEIEHAHKAWMVERGEWRPGPHPQFPEIPAPESCEGKASFHIWAAYSYSPNATWAHIATEFVKANAAGPDSLKTFVNTWLGETWQDRGEAPEWRRLYDRRESYAIRTCPVGVLFLTLGVDVQHDRLYYEVVGWGRGKESWSIDADVIMGDTSDLSTKGPWAQLDALLNRTYEHASGHQLTIRMAAIDSGDQTQTVYNYVRTKDAGRVMAVKGVDHGHVLVEPGGKVDVSANGQRVGRIQLWRVCSDIAKSELYGWLKLEAPTDDQRDAGETIPPGFCHFPQYGEQFFKQLTAEQRVPHRSPKGFMVSTWELIPGRENHWLDCRNYARAAANRAGLDRAREADFAALEGAPTQPPIQSATPPPAQPPRRGRADRQPGWLQGRRGGWLKGDR